MNRLKLRHRLLLLTLLPSTLVALALVVYFTLSGIDALESQLRDRGLATVRSLAPISEYGIIAGQADSLHNLVQASVQEPDVKAAIIVNPKGRTLAVSGRVSLPAEHLLSAPTKATKIIETADWIAYGAPVIRSQNDIDPLFDFVAETPQNPADAIIGVVFVEFDKRKLAERRQHLLERGLTVAALGLAILAALAITLADTLARPLLRLVEAVGQMSTGQFSARVPASSGGELGILEHGFNEMAEHIEDVHRSMQTRIEDATAQLVFQARHDALTGLINRREFELSLQRALEAVQAGGEEFSVLYIDLDRFKPVNDACGHLAGDELLRQIALLFKGRLREQDTLGRLGGDEFGIILFNCTGERAQQVANDLCALATDYRFVWHERIFAIGASIGMTQVSRQTRDIQEIIGISDTACQQAKASGRNRVCVLASQPAVDRRQPHGNWASRLASALDDGRLMVEALPLKALQPGLTSGHIAELAARLNEPGQPPVALSTLIDTAERYDLAHLFDRHFLRTALDALARAAEHNRRLTCIVPLSRDAIKNPDTGNLISERLRSLKLDGQNLCLLFPEELATQQGSQLIEFSRRMHELGCQIALDDFGGGLTSFNQLRMLEPAFVKLGQSLTRNASSSKASSALLRAVLEITAEQGIRSIAENLDDTLHLQEMKLLGVAYAQGLAAAPREPFDAWLEGAVLRGSIPFGRNDR